MYIVHVLQTCTYSVYALTISNNIDECPNRSDFVDSNVGTLYLQI